MSRLYKINDHEYYFNNERFLPEFNNRYLQLSEEGVVKNLDEFFEYFAKRTNYSVETIRKWRKGENTPSGLEDIKCIASFLGIEYTSLLTYYPRADFAPYRSLTGKGKRMRNKRMEELGIIRREVFETLRYTLWNDLTVDIIIKKPGEENADTAIVLLGGELKLCSLKRETIQDEMKVLDILSNIIDDDVLEYYFEEYQMLKSYAGNGIVTCSSNPELVPMVEEKWWRRDGYEERMAEYWQKRKEAEKYILSETPDFSMDLWKGDF